MAVTAILFGLALIALGLGGFVGTGSSSLTALIPAAFGLALSFLGAFALKESLRKHAMHLASLLALVGIVVPAVMVVLTLSRFLSTGKLIHQNGADATTAVILQSIMAVVCAVFLGLCIRSFVLARRRRHAEAIKSTVR